MAAMGLVYVVILPPKNISFVRSVWGPGPSPVLLSAGQMSTTSTFWLDLYAINDDETYSDAEREELITAKFATVGITVHFKG